MRLQLKPDLILVLAGALGVAGAEPALARVEGSTRLTIFREPSSINRGIEVTHPQADVTGDITKSVSIGAGYELDVVSGATPTVFAPTTGPDAVSAATRFSDERHAARGVLGVNTPLLGLSASYSYGWEKDYKSHTLSASARGDFLERNFTLGLAYTRNIDSVCDQNNENAQSLVALEPLSSSAHCFQSGQTDVVSRAVNVHTFEPSLVWTASPRLLLQLGSTLQVNDGFQSNPYRRVRIGPEGAAPQEHVPRLRQRYALFTRANYAVPLLRSALSAMGRVYRDTWDLRAATAELGVSTYVGSSLLFGLRGRYHAQSGAVFYRTAQDYILYGPVGEYWTGDRELSPMQTWLGGARLVYLKRKEQQESWLEELEVSVKFDILLYKLEPGAPSSDRKGAFISQAGVALRF